MDDKRLDEIRAREQAATAGPWATWQGDMDSYWAGHDAPSNKLWNVDTEGRWIARKVWDGEDATFIANARTDIPDLLALVESQRAIVGAAQALYDGLHNHGWFGPLWDELGAALAEQAPHGVQGAEE